MNFLEINHCPGTLAEGFSTYSRTCLNKVFQGKKVNHILPYNSPSSGTETDTLFEENRNRISISGVQEKFSVVLEKNKLRLVNEKEIGQYILKPIPSFGKKVNQMPANEHLTMQIAKQVYAIETAENALIFFNNGEPAYLTKRFDFNKEGNKLAQEDFASLAQRTPQTHGEHYKYLGNYYDLFELMKEHLPAYLFEAPKLLKLLVFNYLFSNGDAHFKKFSLLETTDGDFVLSPAYDLLNTEMHLAEIDFALHGGLYPKSQYQGKLLNQFQQLGKLANIPEKMVELLLNQMLAKTTDVERLIRSSFLDENAQKNYYQAYQGRLKRLKYT